MSPAEASALLGVAAAFDNRKPDADAATAWSLALDGIRFIDARDAIVAHYRATTEWLMPAHVIAEVRRIRRDRLAEAPPVSPPPELDPDDTEAYTRWWGKTRRAIADGEPLQTQPALESRPMPDLEAVMPRVIAGPVIAKERDPQHEQRKAAATAELEPLRARLAEETAHLTPDEPPVKREAAVAVAAEGSVKS